MSKEQDNKATVGRWFTDFWGETCNLAVVDEIAGAAHGPYLACDIGGNKTMPPLGRSAALR